MFFSHSLLSTIGLFFFIEMSVVDPRTGDNPALPHPRHVEQNVGMGDATLPKLPNDGMGY